MEPKTREPDEKVSQTLSSDAWQSKNKNHILWKLFWSTIYISAFTFGGGFVIITFMKRKFVDELHWIDEQEMLDLAALAQSSPGAIAVNAAILVGWRVAGFAGMLVAVVGTILPPMLILLVISYFYAAFASNLYVSLVLKGMQAGVAAVILNVVCDLYGKAIPYRKKKDGQPGDCLKDRSPIHMLVMAAAFVASFFFGVNVVYIILASAVVGIFLEIGKHRKESVV